MKLPFPLFFLPIFLCFAAPPKEKREKLTDENFVENGVKNLCETFDRLGLKFGQFNANNGQIWESDRKMGNKNNEKIKIKNENKRTKQKKSKCNKPSGIIKQIGALAMIPLLFTGAATGSSPLLNSSNANFSSLQMPFYGTPNVLQINNFYRNLSTADEEAVNGDKLCIIQLSGQNELKLKNQQMKINSIFEKESENKNGMKEKIKMAQEKWQNDANAKINFDILFKKFDVTNDDEKLSLLEELSQRAIGAKSRCEEQINLFDYGILEKIGRTFFSVDRTFILETKHIKSYNGNSEHFGTCVAIVEFNTKNLRPYLVEKLKNEIKIYKKLSKDSKHMLRMFESEQNEHTLKMVTEIVRLDFWEVWYRNDTENSFEIRDILFNEMLKALEKFHKNGIHLNINLTKFYFVEEKNDENENDDKKVIMEIEGQKLKLKTKLADFGASILFNEKPPNLNFGTDYYYNSVYGDGTPAYMCPEQISGSALKLTPKCDIFSLGIVLYEMLVPEVGNPFHFMCREAFAYEECVKLLISRGKLAVSIEENEKRYLWNIAMASLLKDPKARPNAKGIRKYLRGECRLRVGDNEFGINNDVPMIKCDME